MIRGLIRIAKMSIKTMIRCLLAALRRAASMSTATTTTATSVLRVAGSSRFLALGLLALVLEVVCC